MEIIISFLITILAFFTAYQAQAYWLWNMEMVIALYTIAGWLSGITTVLFFIGLEKDARRNLEERNKRGSG